MQIEMFPSKTTNQINGKISLLEGKKRLTKIYFQVDDNENSRRH